MTAIVSRRALLAAGAAGHALGGARLRAAHAAAPDRGVYLGGALTPDGVWRYSGVDADGCLVLDVPLPGRAHGCALRPDGREIAITARRPDRFVVIADRRTGAIRRTLRPPPGHHVYGHAAYRVDGARLYVTENAYDAEEPGVMAVYDATEGYRRMATWPTGGIGPHEVRLMPDGAGLAIANGGLRTHPDTGRAVLNLGSMDASLALMDPADGRLLDQARLPARWRLNSIRHIAATPDGRVVAVSQWQGGPSERPPLVAVWRPGGALVPLSAPPEVQARMRNYCGSVCVDVAGRMAAASAPRGGLITLWDLDAEAFAGAVEVPDGCGVAPDGTPGGFILTSGAGGVWRHGRDGTAPLPGEAATARRWDNHLTRMKA
ncbi:DUF1513 domain-containing protein [Roseospira navarrensis]|uniref:DUF1513 domain-containing protein n=1 Tax=Roseospira navarrensis TaxID=140058 RepID=A0A7X1ZG30_9PROT|nr:DUF1513 domain-containing protein [Roseospira navarrensis]MQX37820.1 DUF1513 domain-containing protein [Roseospira navarrensis]